MRVPAAASEPRAGLQRSVQVTLASRRSQPSSQYVMRSDVPVDVAA